jgi:hypothetical protein
MACRRGEIAARNAGTPQNSIVEFSLGRRCKFCRLGAEATRCEEISALGRKVFPSAGRGAAGKTSSRDGFDRLHGTRRWDHARAFERYRFVPNRVKSVS